MSIATGMFPDAFKIAKVTPCFKKGDKIDKSNYRHISVLPLLSNIIESMLLKTLNPTWKQMIYSMSDSLGSEETTLAKLP